LKGAAKDMSPSQEQTQQQPQQQQQQEQDNTVETLRQLHPSAGKFNFISHKHARLRNDQLCVEWDVKTY